MDRRTFLKGLVATAAGVLVPGSVAAEPDRRVWALDRTMVAAPTYTIRESGSLFPILAGSVISCEIEYEDMVHAIDSLYVAETIRNPDGTYTHTFTGGRLPTNLVARVYR